MSNTTKKTEAAQLKEHTEWLAQNMREKALNLAVGLVRAGAYDPKGIVKDAQVFYEFLKGKK